MRTIYQCAKTRDKAYLFEERIVAICAESDVQAFAKAEREGDSYAGAVNSTPMGEIVFYLQDGDDLIDGYEIWSVLLDSDDPYDVFFAKRYGSYESHTQAQ